MPERQKPDDAQTPDDPVARLRERADNMAATAAAMKKIADAADPLYKTLDDGQKRRLAILTHMEGGRFGGGWRHREFDRDQIAMAAIGIGVSTVTAAMTATAARAGIMAAGTDPSGSDRTDLRRIES